MNINLIINPPQTNAMDPVPIMSMEPNTELIPALMAILNVILVVPAAGPILILTPGLILIPILAPMFNLDM